MLPSFPIDTNHSLFQSLAVPALRIPLVPSKKKSKFKDYDFYDDAQFGYEYDNQCGQFIGDVVGEEYYDDAKDIIDSMVGGV